MPFWVAPPKQPCAPTPRLAPHRRVGSVFGVIFAFGEFELDLAVAELRRAGVRVPIEPQVFAVLAHLVAHRDRVVAKEELLDTVWAAGSSPRPR